MSVKEGVLSRPCPNLWRSILTSLFMTFSWLIFSFEGDPKSAEDQGKTLFQKGDWECAASSSVVVVSTCLLVLGGVCWIWFWLKSAEEDIVVSLLMFSDCTGTEAGFGTTLKSINPAVRTVGLETVFALLSAVVVFLELDVFRSKAEDALFRTLDWPFEPEPEPKEEEEEEDKLKLLLRLGLVLTNWKYQKVNSRKRRTGERTDRESRERAERDNREREQRENRDRET
jgi:hypothetical protein